MKRSLLLIATLLIMGGAEAKKDIAGHVIVIGLDGWGSWCMERGQAPFIRQTMPLGCYTLNKRTVRPSISGANWAAQVNGTPVESSGITNNDNKPTFKPLYLTEHNAQPTLFHLLRQTRPQAELGVIREWGDFQNYVDTLCLSYNKKVTNENVVEESVKYIKEKKPLFCFIHIDALDHAGHSYGQGTKEYYDMLTHVDGQVARIVEGIKAAGIYDDTIIILTSDHGHEGTGHGGDTLNEIETPFVIWGKGVKKGKEITDTMIQYDVAATIAKVFRLDTPQSWRGIPMDVFK